MTSEEHESKMIQHLERIIGNLNQHWHSIELLLSHVSKPLTVDDRGLAEVVKFLNQQIRSIISCIQNLDITQVLGEIKYIGIRLNNIDQTLAELKECGIKKQVQLDISCEGYELVKKKPSRKDDIPDMDEDPEANVKALLQTLTKREELVITHRLGLFGEKKKTLEAIGGIIGVTKEVVRQNFNKAIRKCRHPERKELAEKITHIEFRKLLYVD